MPLLQRCTEADATMPRAHFQLASALAAKGDRAPAVDAFGKELEINEDPKVQVMARLNRAMLLEQERRFVDAAREFEAVLELEPVRTEIYGEVARLLLKGDEVSEAAASLERICRWTSCACSGDAVTPVPMAHTGS